MRVIDDPDSIQIAAPENVDALPLVKRNPSQEVAVPPLTIMTLFEFAPSSVHLAATSEHLNVNAFVAQKLEYESEGHVPVKTESGVATIVS